MSEWQPIETVPKDGSLVELTWMENGEPQDIFTMRWSAIARNGLFPGKVGFWITPCGSLTWNEDGDGGPDAWRYPAEPSQ